jgi:hypothetical protein
MKKSVHQLIQEAIIENNINLNSPYKLEAILLIDKVCDKIDWSIRNPNQIERKLNVIRKSVNMLFKNLK